MANLVPITRELLKEYYKKYPCPQLTKEFTESAAKADAFIVKLNLASGLTSINITWLLVTDVFFEKSCIQNELKLLREVMRIFGSNEKCAS